MKVRAKRVYEEPSPDDGLRVLVDGRWPREVGRGEARLDEWAPELAPSRDLRVWFSHQPERFEKFRLTYIDELRERRACLAALRARAQAGVVTLLYAARDREHNNAVVLAEVLQRGLAEVETPWRAGSHR